MELKPIRTALISVFNKDGIGELVTYLHQNGVQILSTGGTQKYLESLDIPVTAVETLTTYPSILGGRVKTLHPVIFGGILNRSENSQDEKDLVEHQIGNIDLVWVDLYPFSETVQNTKSESEIIEKIDIGGVSLLRAAAKNFSDKVVLCNLQQADVLLNHLIQNKVHTTREFRERLAGQAFETTREYDTHISRYFMGDSITSLRYGENPHQTAEFQGNLEKSLKQLNGKTISYNNLLDIDSSLGLIGDYRSIDGHIFAILKHNNACGLAIRPNLFEAYQAALDADPISAFGGILATHSSIDLETAEAMDHLFFELILAPSYEPDALKVLQRKKNRIILQTSEFEFPVNQTRSILDGLLVQERDKGINEISDFSHVSTTVPDNETLKDLFFANIAVKHTKSNAVVLVKNNQLLASGTGQTSRVDALNQAIAKAGAFGFDLHGSVMASDAFFPFPDCVEIAHKAGITGVIQPGGSIKDQLSIDYCNEHGLTMTMTGMRHFRH